MKKSKKIEKKNWTAEEVAAWEAAQAKEEAHELARRAAKQAERKAAQAAYEETSTSLQARGAEVTMRSVYMKWTADWRKAGDQTYNEDGAKQCYFECRHDNGAYQARRMRHECERVVSEGLLTLANSVEDACKRFARPSECKDLPLESIATPEGLKAHEDWLDGDMCRCVEWEMSRIERTIEDMKGAMLRIRAAQELDMGKRLSKIIKKDELRAVNGGCL